MEIEKIRLDKYLWCIRLFKTRSQAAEACEQGKVKLNQENIKASRTVKPGEEYAIKTAHKHWKIKVKGLLSQRLSFQEVQHYYEDLTPPEDTTGMQFQATSFPTGKRLSKQGRPTKKDKRDLDEWWQEAG